MTRKTAERPVRGVRRIYARGRLLMSAVVIKRAQHCPHTRPATEATYLASSHLEVVVVIVGCAEILADGKDVKTLSATVAGDASGVDGMKTGTPDANAKALAGMVCTGVGPAGLLRDRLSAVGWTIVQDGFKFGVSK